MKTTAAGSLAGVEWNTGISSTAPTAPAFDEPRADWRSWSELSTWVPSVAILFVGLCMVAWLYFTPAYVPDEVWFRGLVEKNTSVLAEKGLWKLIWIQENDLAYGSIYWIIYTLLAQWFAHPIVVVRWLALAAMATVPACAAVYAWQIRSRLGWLAVLLWFTFPMCWWSGKLTGPEVFSFALSTIGITILLLQCRRRAIFIGAAFLGLAIGIKLATIPVLAFAAIVTWRRNERKRDAVIMVACGLLAGFLIANPFVLFRPGRFIRVLRHLANDQNYPGPRLSFAYVAYLLSNTVWEWDLVYRGGFFNWGLTIPAFVVWAVLLWRGKTDRSVVVAFLLTLMAATTMFVIQARYVGWYWFPIVALIPLMTCDARIPNMRETLAFAVGLLVLNVSMSQGIIRQQWQAKSTHLTAIQEGPRQQQLIEAQIRSDSPGISRLIWCMPPGAVVHPTAPGTVLAADDFQGYRETEAYTWISQAGFLTEIQPGHTGCIVLYRKYHPIWDNMRDNPCLDIRNKFQITEVALDQDPVDLVFLSRR
jgi:hypothetical protein